MAGKGDTYRPVVKSKWDENYSQIRGFKGYVPPKEEQQPESPDDREADTERPVDGSER